MKNNEFFNQKKPGNELFPSKNIQSQILEL